jgi:hypothetical protein
MERLDREGMKELFFILYKSALKNIYIHRATCSCIIELYDNKRRLHFSQTVIFLHGFLSISLISPEGIAKLLWGAGHWKIFNKEILKLIHLYPKETSSL